MEEDEKMKYLTYDKEIKMFCVYEAKMHKYKPTIEIDLLMSTLSLDNAIDCLKRDKK